MAIDIKTTRAALSPNGLGLPKGASSELKRAASIRSYASDKGSSGLVVGCVVLAVYAEFDRLRALAEVLGSPDDQFDHLQLVDQRSAFATALYPNLVRGIDDPASALLSKWSVKTSLMQGLGLRGYVDRSDDERDMDEFMPVSGHVGMYAADLSILSTMWVFGGSAEWPRDRIEQEWDRNAEAVRALPGFAGGDADAGR